MRKSDLVLALALTAAPMSGAPWAADLNPNDLRPHIYSQRTPLALEQRMSIVQTLQSDGRAYLAALESVSWESFRSVNAPPEEVAALGQELEDTKTLIGDLVVQLDKLSHDPFNNRIWLLVTRNYFSVAPYIQDLAQRRLVKSDAHIGLRLWLGVVFDNILLAEP